MQSYGTITSYNVHQKKKIQVAMAMVLFLQMTRKYYLE